MGKCKNCGFEKENHEIIETLNDDGTWEQHYVCHARLRFEEDSECN